MTLFKAFILGVVEGLTEFLPVSSTGHLILATRLLNISPTEFIKTFEIAIQLGAVLAVVVLYFQKLFFREMWKKVGVALLPSIVLGLLFYKVFRSFLGNSKIVLFSLFAGGVFLILFEMWYQRRRFLPQSDVSYLSALWIGLFQVLAIVPGVSRSAATIIGGLFLGWERKTTVEFSFLLAIPTLFLATLWDLYKNLNALGDQENIFLLVGFFTAFLVALGALNFFRRFIKRYNFIPFGVYRILAAILFYFLLFRL